ncbi:MAG TPA: type II toxin-antitoxin system Phd/YefM family antitoxin [Thermoanaerobaculia bacterium]|nr:type II toxin-antitoxin system Phd/YefM family antitoxin [Thermoanaerobaculia bacterium]
MTTLSTTEAHEKFPELLHRVAADKERIVLTRAGEELVAVVPIEDLALMEALEDRADIEDAREALREAREKGTTSLADLKALLDKIATELRDVPALSDEAVSRAGIYADHP